MARSHGVMVTSKEVVSVFEGATDFIVARDEPAKPTALMAAENGITDSEDAEPCALERNRVAKHLSTSDINEADSEGEKS